MVMPIEFLGEKQCEVIIDKYKHDLTYALLLQDLNGAPICTASVCIPGLDWDFIKKGLEIKGKSLGKHFVVIKNWSENYGIYEALIEAGVINEKIEDIETGFVNAYLCNFTEPFINAYEEQHGWD